MAALLDRKFWDRLTQISASVNINPKDLLAVMYYESGLNPSSHNTNGNASGLIQFMPDTLKGLGFTGNHSDFRNLDALKQLDYVEKYITSKHSGGFKSAAQYYVANLWPAALSLPGVKQEDPNTIIIDSNPTTQRYKGVSLEFEKNAYNANAGLDVNKDGKITYGDLQAVMQGVKNSANYRQAVSAMENGSTFEVKDKVKSVQPTQKSTSFVDQLSGLLDRFMAAVATEYVTSNLVKKSMFNKLPKNNLLISVSCNNLIDSLEFSRVLSAALEEETQSITTIYTDRKNVEVLCQINGPKKICFDAVSQLCNAVADTFKVATKKIGGVEVKTKVYENKLSNYQELDIKLAQSAYRQFHFKFIK